MYQGVRDVAALICLVLSVPVLPPSASFAGLAAMLLALIQSYRTATGCTKGDKWRATDAPDPGLEKTRRESYPEEYANGYYHLLRSADLAPGQIKQINALGKNFAVFRPEDGGKACVIDAICPHMG